MNEKFNYEVSHIVVNPHLIAFRKQKPKGRHTRLEAYFDLLSMAMVKKPFSVLPKTPSEGKEEHYVYNERELSKLLKEKNWDRNDKSILMQRFKGLGEMNSEQLWDTTMNPETRQIIKVEVEDHVVTDDVLTVLMGRALPLYKLSAPAKS